MRFFKKSRQLNTIIGGSLLALALLSIFVFGHNNTLAAKVPSSPQMVAYPPRNMGTTWLAIPSFSNEVLHWTQIVSSYTINNIDPNNGKTMTGDIVVWVGSDGVPTRIQTKYVSTDNALLQETIQTRDTTTIFLGNNYSRSGCNVIHKTLSDQDLLSFLPLFSHEVNLPSAGYVLKNNSITHALPTITPFQGFVPVKTYPSNGTMHQWEIHSLLGDKKTDIQTLGTDATGRILMQDVKLVNSNGSLIQDNWHTYGALDIYDSKSLSNLNFSSLVLGGCNA